MQGNPPKVSQTELEQEATSSLSEVQESMVDRTSLASYYFRVLETLKQLNIYEECSDSHEFSYLHAKCTELLIACASLTSKHALFVEKENIKSVPTSALQFMRIDFLLADILFRTPLSFCAGSEFRYGSVLKLVVSHSLRFAALLDSYGLNTDGAFDDMVERMLPEGPFGKLKIDWSVEFNDKARKEKKRLINQYERVLEHNIMGHSRDAKFPTLRDSIIRESEIIRLKINLVEARFLIERAFTQLRTFRVSSEKCAKYLISEEIISPSPLLSDKLLGILFDSPIMRSASDRCNDESAPHTDVGPLAGIRGTNFNDNVETYAMNGLAYPGNYANPAVAYTNNGISYNGFTYATMDNKGTSNVVYTNSDLLSSQHTADPFTEDLPVLKYRHGYKNDSLLEPGMRFDYVGPPSFPDGVINRPLLVTDRNVSQIYKSESVEDPLDGVDGKETMQLVGKFNQLKQDIFADIDV